MSDFASSLNAQAVPGTVASDRGVAAVNWRRAAAFVGLAFGLSWLLDLGLYLAGGLTHPAAMVVLQTQMLMPALAAIALGVFALADSPLYFRTNRAASRWFCYFYLVLAVAYLGLSAAALAVPGAAAIAAGLGALPAIVGLLLVIVLRLVGGKGAFASAGMAGGGARNWLFYGVGLAAFYGLQTFLNYAFGLGRVPDLTPMMAALGPSATAMPLTTFLILGAAQGILLGPFLGLLFGFGEEYGWRGFLQGELTRLGRVRGVLLVGLIWGVWHAPVILMGYNYPGYPLLGSLLMVAYCVLLGFFLGYAVLRTGGVWLAAFLHALNNQVMGTLFALVYTPKGPIFSFGIGVFGIASAAVAVLFILRDPVWRERQA